MIPKQRVSISEATSLTIAALGGYGDNPAAEALYIFSKILQLNRAKILATPTLLLNDEQISELNKVISQRKKHTPLAYIFGEEEFYGYIFKVNNSTLIPRPETEQLVEKTIQWAERSGNDTLSCLEVGTGSGCIAITLALNIPKIQVTAIDISARALEVAEQNKQLLGVPAQRINFLKADVFKFEPKTSFDMIISNPPYITEAELVSLPPEIAEFEPELALNGGKDGLRYYERLLQLCASHLTKSGSAFFELNSTTALKVLKLAKSVLNTSFSISLEQDLAGKPRFLRVSHV
jgi:release factor glutamine methyltransferase